MRVVYPKKMPKEITLKELCDDSYDWKCVFGEECEYNCDAEVESYDETSCGPVSRADVKKIIAALNGENDSCDWVGLFLLKDGRYLAATGGCDYTGWDCQASNTLVVGATLDSVVRFGIDDTARGRFGITLEDE